MADTPPLVPPSDQPPNGPRFNAPRLQPSGAAAGGSSVAVLVWIWDSYELGPKMPAEVAASLVIFLGPALAYLVAWLPSPSRRRGKDQ